MSEALVKIDKPVRQLQEFLHVKLEAEPQSANATAVSATIDAIVAVLKEAEKQIGSQYSLQIKTRPLAPGSVIIPFELAITAGLGLAGATIYIAAGMPYFDEIRKLFKSFFELKKLLKGQPVPESAANSGIRIDKQTFNAEQMNVYMSLAVNEAMAKFAKEVEKDENITGVEFGTGEETVPLERLSREELSYLHTPSPEIKLLPQTREKHVKKVKLVVRKPILFESKERWSFLYKEEQILAEINDKTWLQKKVLSGVDRFGAGDRLVVDLTLHQEFDAAVDMWETKRYSITHVHSHVGRDEQLTLPFDEAKKKAAKKAAKKKPVRKKASAKQKSQPRKPKK